jgi:hypothetical protein
LNGRASARADQIELIRKKEGGPRLAKDEPATRDMRNATSGAT